MTDHRSTADIVDPIAKNPQKSQMPIKKRTWYDPATFIQLGVNLKPILNTAIYDNSGGTHTFADKKHCPSCGKSIRRKWKIGVFKSIKAVLFHLPRRFVEPIASRWRAYLSRQIIAAINHQLMTQASHDAQRLDMLQKTILKELQQTRESINAALQAQANHYDQQLKVLQQAILVKKSNP